MGNKAIKGTSPVLRKLINDVDRANRIEGPTGIGDIEKSKRKKYVFDSSSARKKDLKQQAYRAEVEKLGGKVTFAGEWKKGGKV